MAATIFDTHVAFKNLTRAGIPDEQAEAIINAMTHGFDNTVTKEYLDDVIDRLLLRTTHRSFLISYSAIGALFMLQKLFS